MFRQTLSYCTTVLYRSFADYTSRQLQQLGLNRGMLFLIIYTGKHPGCTQGELTAALGLDAGYAQRSLLKLVEEGFLLREKRGRAYCLELSEKGRRAFDVGHQVFFDWDDRVLGRLEPAQREQLLALLEQAARLEKEAGADPCTNS